MGTSAKNAVFRAIAHAEQYAAVLTPQVRRDIALGHVTLWARMQDDPSSARLAETIVQMGDEIVLHYSAL